MLRATRNNRHPEKSLLRTFVHCAHCGYTLHARRGRYRCTHNNVAPGQCPANPTIAIDKLDTATWERVEAMLTEPDVVAVELERLIGNDPTEQEAATVRRQLAAVRQRHKTLRTNLAQTTMSAKTAQRTAEDLATLEADEDRLLAQLETIAAQRATWEAAQERLTDLQAWCQQVADQLSQLTYDQKRLAFDYLALDVRVRDSDAYEIAAALPLDVSVANRRSRTSFDNRQPPDPLK
jgi:hypothetical protein